MIGGEDVDISRKVGEGNTQRGILAFLPSHCTFGYPGNEDLDEGGLMFCLFL
jgi:hypothetical protein